MDIVVASSRGKGLQELIIPHHPSPDSFLIHYSSGATMSRLCAQAQSILSSVTSPGHHHVYFIGGYCDITRRIKYALPNLFRHRRPAIYEEYIFVEPQDTAVQRMALTFRDTATVVIGTGGNPSLLHHSAILPRGLEPH